MRTILLFILSFIIAAFSIKADESVTLVFSAKHPGGHVKLDSILVENLTQDGSLMLYGGDTVLVLTITHIDFMGSGYNGFYVSQNYPNPFSSETTIDVYVAEADVFTLDVYDLTGRKLTSYGSVLQPGMHHFTFHACNLQNYILTVGSKKYKQQRLMIQMGQAGTSSPGITYNGISTQMKAVQYYKSDTGFPFDPGDELRFIGYVTGEYGNVSYDIITDAPTTDMEYVFDITFPTYNLALNADPEEGGIVDGDGEYQEGEGATIIATANEGYEFINWTGDTEHVDDPGSDTATVIMPAEDAELTANFKMQDYHLTLGANPEEGGNLAGEGEYNMGEEVEIVAEANEGWEFVEWTGDTEHVDDPGSATAIVTMPAENVNLTANFNMLYYQLSLEADPEEGGNVAGEGEYNMGEEVEIVAEANEGWVFVEWTGDIEHVNDLGSATTIVTMPAKDVELTANFAPLHTLTLNTNPEGAGIVYGAGEYMEGEEVEITAEAVEGCDFIEWTGYTEYVDDPGSATAIVTMPADDIELTANFEVQENYYILTLVACPGAGGTVEGAGVYQAGALVNVTATSNPGSMFINWTDEYAVQVSANTEYTFNMPAEDMTLKAYFKYPGDGVTDIDGNTYPTYIIGCNYEWMATNLKTTTYNDGNEIPNVTDNEEWTNLSTGAYCWYNNDYGQYGIIYGALYNAYAVETGKLCPDGWRVPTDEEWKYLEGTVDTQYGIGDPVWDGTGYGRGYDCGIRLKASGMYGSNEYGFTGTAGGVRFFFNGNFGNVGVAGFWWGSTIGPANGWRRSLSIAQETVARGYYDKRSGYSVRCVRDVD